MVRIVLAVVLGALDDLKACLASFWPIARLMEKHVTNPTTNNVTLILKRILMTILLAR
jgi:hypothetical protein